tara:strand:- start:16607 stop:18232 length:1626 start_codon:yes stop_codon:yes gene_type:complete
MTTKKVKLLAQNKQKTISRVEGYPSKKSGRDGDFQVRKISGQGIFLFYKWHNQWYSARLNQYRPKTSEHKEPIKVPIGVKPTKRGELSIDTDGNLKIKKSDKVRQVIAVDADGNADANTIKISRSNTTSTNNGTTNDLVLDNLTGDSSITLKTTASGKDPYISFLKFTAGETFTTSGMIMGMDSTDGSFKWHRTSVTAGGGSPPETTTPSTAGEKMKLDINGNLTLLGELDVNGIEISPFLFISNLGIIRDITLDGDYSTTPGDGSKIHINASTITDDDTSGSGTAAMYNTLTVEEITLAATNASVTTTKASSVYIQGPPIAGTNQTFTKAYALRIGAGDILLDSDDGGTTTIECDNSNLTLDVSGDVTLDADGDQVTIKFGGAAGQIDFTNENSGDGVIQQKVDAKDLVVKQYDGNEVVRFTDGGDVKVTNVVYFAAETANTIGDGATGVIDWNVSQKQKVTITGTGITCNFTNPPGPCNLMLKVIQGDGSDVIGTWDSDIKWPANGTAPTLSTGNGDIDILSFYFDGTNYFGVASLDFA